MLRHGEETELIVGSNICELIASIVIVHCLHVVLIVQTAAQAHRTLPQAVQRSSSDAAAKAAAPSSQPGAAARTGVKAVVNIGRVELEMMSNLPEHRTIEALARFQVNCTIVLTGACTLKVLCKLSMHGLASRCPHGCLSLDRCLTCG